MTAAAPASLPDRVSGSVSCAPAFPLGRGAFPSPDRDGGTIPPPSRPAAPLPGGGDLFAAPPPAPAEAAPAPYRDTDTCEECGVDPCVCEGPRAAAEAECLRVVEAAFPIEPLADLPAVASAKADVPRVNIGQLPLAEAFLLANCGLPRADGRDAMYGVTAFVARRLELQERHGAGSVANPERGAYQLAGDARDRLAAVRDRLAGRRPGREQLELAQNTVRTAGAILAALDDAIAAELKEAAKGEAGCS